MAVNIEIGADLRTLFEKLDEAAEKVASIGTKLQEVGAAMTVAVTAPLGLIAKKAIDASGELEGVYGQLKQIKDQALSELGSEIIKTFNLKENIQKFAAFLGKVLYAFKNLNPKVKKAVLIFAAVAAAIGPVIGFLGTLMTILPILTTMFTILTGPIGLVIAIVIALAAAFIYVRDNLGAFGDYFFNLWVKIKNFFIDGIKAMLMPLNFLLKKLGMGFGDDVLNWLDSLKGKTRENAEEFGSFGRAFKNMMKDVTGIESLSTGNQKFEIIDSEGVAQSAGVVKNEVQDLGHYIKGTLEPIKDIDLMPKIGTPEQIKGLEVGMIKFKEKALGYLESIGAEVAAAFNRGLEQLANNSATIIGQFLGDLATGSDVTIKDFGANILSAIASFMSQFGKSMVAIGIAQYGINAAIASMNPALAIAAGVALIAAGAALSNIASRGIAGASSGGGGGSFSSGVSGSGGSSFGSANEPMVLETRIQGREMILISNRESTFRR